jgi:uncharacterized protein YbaR (Trm112 family)
VPLDSLLVEILVDPEDKQPLWYFSSDEVLYNPRLRRRYDIKDGIPVLLVSEATTVDDDEHVRREAARAEATETGLGPKSDPT